MQPKYIREVEHEERFQADGIASGHSETASPAGAGDIFRRRLGDIEIIALCDETFDMDTGLLTEADPGAVADLLDGADTRASCNAYLVRQNGMTILVDSGAGDTFAGSLQKALTRAGVAPENIDFVLLTHLHLDHVGGLLRQGKPAFPNAEIRLAEVERDFWFDDAGLARMSERLSPRLGEEFTALHVKVAREALAAYGDRVRCFAGLGKVLSGVEAIPLRGHTPGHTGYLFGSGKERFLAWGDMVHVAAVQFSLPDACMLFDWDARLAAGARRWAFAEAATQGWLAAGAHLPFPGLGRLWRSGDTFRFAPLDGNGHA